MTKILIGALALTLVACTIYFIGRFIIFLITNSESRDGKNSSPRDRINRWKASWRKAGEDFEQCFILGFSVIVLSIAVGAILFLLGTAIVGS